MPSALEPVKQSSMSFRKQIILGHEHHWAPFYPGSIWLPVWRLSKARGHHQLLKVPAVVSLFASPSRYPRVADASAFLPYFRSLVPIGGTRDF